MHVINRWKRSVTEAMDNARLRRDRAAYHEVVLMLRRLVQLEVALNHFRGVLKEGKRPLSTQELWRVEQIAQEAAELARSARCKLSPSYKLLAEGEDIPGIKDVPVPRERKDR